MGALVVCAVLVIGFVLIALLVKDCQDKLRRFGNVMRHREAQASGRHKYLHVDYDGSTSFQPVIYGDHEHAMDV